MKKETAEDAEGTEGQKPSGFLRVLRVLYG